MDEEIRVFLQGKIEQYRNNGFALSYVLGELRRKSMVWLFDNGYGRNSLTQDDLTRIAVQVLCDAGVHIN